MSGAGNLTINGALADGGSVTFDQPRNVIITSAGDDSGDTFTVTGTDETGTAQTEDITGADTGVTWLSENAELTLLYAALVEAYTFMKGDADLMQLYDQRCNLEVLRLKNQAEARGRRDEYRYDALRTSVS